MIYIETLVIFPSRLPKSGPVGHNAIKPNSQCQDIHQLYSIANMSNDIEIV